MSLASFTQQRFLGCLTYLGSQGLTVVDGREPSRWTEHTHCEPPQGYLHIKAFGSPADTEPVAFLELSERWTQAPAHDWSHERVGSGCFLHAASYHLAIAGQHERYDLDMEGHPERPCHRHGPTDGLRRDWSPPAGDLVPWAAALLWQRYADALAAL